MMAPEPGGHRAHIRFRAGIGGEPVLEEMGASSALTFQPAPWGAWLAAPAGRPAPGDHHSLAVAVGVGCCAEIRSLTAALAARPGLDGPGAAAGSSLNVSATVASDAMLSWVPEPATATGGSDHRCEQVVQLASSARLLWRDEFRLETRPDGAAGTWRSRLRVTRDGWPVVSSELAIGPGSPLWDSPAVLGGARAVTSMVVVDPGQALEAWAAARSMTGSARGVALPLSAPGLQMIAWGDDLRDCRAAIDSMLAPAGVPPWAAGRWNGRRQPPGR